MQKVKSVCESEVFDALFNLQDVYYSKTSPCMREYYEISKRMDQLSPDILLRRLNTGEFKEWIVVAVYNKNNTKRLLVKRFLTGIKEVESRRKLEEITGIEIGPDLVRVVNKLLKNGEGNSYDAIFANGYTIEIKTAIDINSPLSFTPKKTVSDTIFSHFDDNSVKIYSIINSEDIKNVKVNLNESFSDQQEQGRRPRLTMADFLNQTGNDPSNPQYVMNISEII